MAWLFPAAEQQWAHSCCSASSLESAFQGPVTAIEADILMGTIESEHGEVPIMAHPPCRTSDLSFEDFWQRCLAEARHHLKLDFKDLRSLQLCLPTVQASKCRLAAQGQGVWINADILPGPNRREPCPIQAEDFMMAVKQWAPGVPLSLGWRVSLAGSDAYTADDVSRMLQVCDSLEAERPEKSLLVFAISARLALRDPGPLLQLLEQKPLSQLLLWTGAGEPALHASSCSKLSKSFPEDRVGMDCRVTESAWEAASNGFKLTCLACLARVGRLVPCLMCS